MADGSVVGLLCSFSPRRLLLSGSVLLLLLPTGNTPGHFFHLGRGDRQAGEITQGHQRDLWEVKWSPIHLEAGESVDGRTASYKAIVSGPKVSPLDT